MPGVTLDGRKDILSITVGAKETSKFWLGMLNDLKKFSSDQVYHAPSESAALNELDGVREKWGKSTPMRLVIGKIIGMMSVRFSSFQMKLDVLCIPPT